MKQVNLKSRFFNHIAYHAESQTVTKTSSHQQKLIEEILWYLQLPEQLRQYVPEIVDFSLRKKSIYLTMHYLGGQTLSELYVRETCTLDEWKRIFPVIEEILAAFSGYAGQLPSGCLEEMYIKKTCQRLTQFMHQSEWPRSVRKKGYYRLNGKIAFCPFRLFERQMKEFRRLLHNPRIHIIHGDLCFSNMLIDPRSGHLTLIDPRGSFGRIGLYGDGRYDLAKIRHSLSGYEHIMHDLFHLQASDDSIDLEIPFTAEQRKLRQEWDRLLGDCLRDVKMIESLLFLSMIPLHRDRPQRQLAMFGLGTMLLYEALS
jgi:hypothetical protein